MDIQKESAVVITVCSTKGGVGKTTVLCSIAAFLAHLELKVLCIDADEQSSLSKFYEYHLTSDHPKSLTTLLSTDVPNLDCISQTEWGELHVITNYDDQLLDWFQKKSSRTVKLKQKVDELREHYDFIFIDTSGSKNKLTEAAVYASDIVLSPIEPTRLCAIEFSDNTLDLIQESLTFRQNNLPPVKYFINKSANTNTSKEISKQIIEAEESFNKLYEFPINPLESVFKQYSCFGESSETHIPVHIDDKRAREQIASIVKELIPDLTDQVNEFMGV